MMKNDGGGAFPSFGTRPTYMPTTSGNFVLTDDGPAPESGMSLRDWFAGQVVGILISHFVYHEKWQIDAAADAYALADAMIAEREKAA